jgi:hypothetical protein
MIQPKPFKIYCPKCGFEKSVQFKSDCLGAGDFKQIPQICPKCGNENLERKTESTSTSLGDTITELFKKALKS